MLEKILVIIVSGLMTFSVCATDYSWNGGSGSFQTDSNWTPTGVPGAADKSVFSVAGPYTVSLNGDVMNANASVGADVTFDLGTYLWQLTNTLSFSGSGIARFDGGTLELGFPGQDYNGPKVSIGSDQKLILDSGTSRFLGPVSLSDGAAFEVNGGDQTLSWSMYLRRPPSGGASFRMTDGYFSMTNNNNSARCTLSTGALMSLEGGTLSIRYQVDINGTRDEPAVINIYTNATLLQSPGIGFNVARSTGGLGIVNILGGSLLLSNSNCNVMNAGVSAVTTGIVNLVDGRFLASLLNNGYTSNGVAIVHQTGGQMQITDSTYVSKQQNTAGYLIQEGGSSWHNQLYVGGYAAPGCMGEVNLSGGTMAVNGSSSAIGKLANTTGRLLQTGGELIFSNSLAVGNAEGAFGVITNTGGSMRIDGTLSLGRSSGGAYGEAWFSGPSNYVSSTIYVGTYDGDFGKLTVADGELACGGIAIVGNDPGSYGELTVTGGELTCSGSITVADDSGSTGMVTIAGGITRCRGIVVGDDGKGYMSISGGLFAMTNGGSLVVGYHAGSDGTLEISGGTNLVIGQGINCGTDGKGSMRITGGFTYTTNRVVYGNYAGSTGTLELAGGVYSVPIIDGRVGSQYNPPGGYSSVLFDGGTLQHSVDGESWMPGAFVSSFAKATLTDRGAVIDSNGGSVTIGQALSNEVGYAGTFTKKGAGKVRLSSWANNFTGLITTEEGELEITGAIKLTGGVAVDTGALFDLDPAGSILDSTTAAGTVSRIDGALTMKSGVDLVIGDGAALGGTGVVTGNVVFASNSVYARDKADGAGVLTVTGDVVIQDDVSVALTGYTVEDLTAGIPLLNTPSGSIQVDGKLPVTLDGQSNPYWWAKSDGQTLTARVIFLGTVILVR